MPEFSGSRDACAVSTVLRMHTKQLIGTVRSTRRRGVTLIEMAVVVAVTAIVASLAVPGLRELVDSRRLLGAATRLAVDVQFARAEAVARNRTVRLSLQTLPGATCYVIHTGSAAQCRCAGDGPAMCTGDAREIRTVVLTTADRVSVEANVASIAFDPQHGTSTPSGTLRAVDPGGRAVHHVVNVMGRVRSCSPAAAVVGYRAC